MLAEPPDSGKGSGHTFILPDRLLQRQNDKIFLIHEPNGTTRLIRTRSSLALPAEEVTAATDGNVRRSKANPPVDIRRQYLHRHIDYNAFKNVKNMRVFFVSLFYILCCCAEEITAGNCGVEKDNRSIHVADGGREGFLWKAIT